MARSTSSPPARVSRIQGWSATGTPSWSSPHQLDDELEARGALRALAGLPDKSRRYLAWKVAGYSYEEIQRLAGGVSYTNVNKPLVKARRCLD